MPSDQTPRISVVLPTYNHEGYVAEAIDGVLAQSRDDWELITIDDCSSDGTWEVVGGYDDPRITALRHEENRGAPATINEGIERARGEFVAILNSDDVYAPERFAEVLAFMEAGDLDFAATDIELIDEAGRVTRDKGHWWIEWFEGLKAEYLVDHDLRRALLCGNMLITTSNFVVRREVFDTIGPFHDYRYVHDYEFLLRLLEERPRRLGFMADCKLLKYRLHSSNTIREAPLAANQETFAILSRWLPAFADDGHRPLIDALARHIAKIEGYVEMELNAASGRQLQEVRTALQQERQEWQAERRELTRTRDEQANRIRTLEGSVERLEQQNASLQERLDQSAERVREKDAFIQGLLGSWSFRVGHGLLTPLRAARMAGRRLTGGGE